MTAFEVEDVFYIAGRGPVITRSQEVSRAAWARGERWRVGEIARCGELVATVTGIERFAVPDGHPAHNDGALLLRGVTIDDLAVGQIWRSGVSISDLADGQAWAAGLQ